MVPQTDGVSTMPSIADWILRDPVTVGIAVFVLIVCLRLLVIVAEELRARPAPVRAPRSGALRRLFPSRLQKLGAEQEFRQARTGLVRATIDEVGAVTQLMRVKAELEATSAELEPAPPPSATRVATLTQIEINGIIALSGSLTAAQRHELLELAAAAIAEKRRP